MIEHDWQTIIGQVPAKSNNYKIVYKFGRPCIVKNDNVGEYEDKFFLQVGTYRNMMINRFFELHIRVFYKTKSLDLDNSLKTVLDCLQYTKTIKNDNNCVKIVAEKYIDKLCPRVEFKIVEV